MFKLHLKHFAITLGIAALTLMADLHTKQMALTYFMDAAEPTIAVTSFFNLALVYNRGISFGMLAAHNQPLMLATMSMAITLVLVVWAARTPFLMVACALGAIIGGAIGNSYDRMTVGAVVDFLDFHLLGYHWPAFNIADSAIFIGVVLLCIHSMFIEPRQLASSDKDK